MREREKERKRCAGHLFIIKNHELAGLNASEKNNE